MIKIKIIKGAGNIFAIRFLKNYSGSDRSELYLSSQRAHWLKDHEGQIGNLTKEYTTLKISIEEDYELFDSNYTDLFEVIE